MALNELPDVEEDRQEQGRFQRDADGTYVATIKIYYTKEFAQAESNVGAYISNMITQANAGLRNSGTKLRLRVLATQQLNNITENRDPVQILTQFVRIKGKKKGLIPCQNNAFVRCSFIYSQAHLQTFEERPISLIFLCARRQIPIVGSPTLGAQDCHLGCPKGIAPSPISPLAMSLVITWDATTTVPIRVVLTLLHLVTLSQTLDVAQCWRKWLSYYLVEF